jgi:hypothetical protein
MSKKRTIDAYFSIPRAKKPRDSESLDDGPAATVNTPILSHFIRKDKMVLSGTGWRNDFRLVEKLETNE